MLEGMTTLGFMAAHSKQARSGLMVGGIHYRNPGLWIKATTTLDVLSGGRAWFGIGAAWNQEESRALGFPFPPLGERFEMLEETLKMAHEAWQGERGSEASVDGRHYQAERLLNSPQSISRPRVPIMVGGGGEKKTLRLVAQYADACNVFGSPEGIARKYAILDAHCARWAATPAEIERSTLQNVGSGRRARHGRSRRRRSSTALPSCPTPAPTTSSSSSRTRTCRSTSRHSGETSSPRSTRCHDIVCHEVYTSVMPGPDSRRSGTRCRRERADDAPLDPRWAPGRLLQGRWPGAHPGACHPRGRGAVCLD